MTARFFAVATVLALVLACAPQSLCAQGAGTPHIIASLASFQGHVSYRARQVDTDLTITGALDVHHAGFTLEESSQNGLIYASSEGSWVERNSVRTYFDDPFEVEAIANAWALALGMSSGTAFTADANGPSWTNPAGVRVFLDSSNTEFAGVTDARSSSDLSFAFGDWVNVGGVNVPQSIVRLRANIPVTSYVLDNYSVTPAVGEPLSADLAPQTVTVQPPLPNKQEPTQPDGLRRFSVLWFLIFLAMAIAAWIRRDALVDRVSAWVAADSRAWRKQQAQCFVSAEGMLTFEGCSYRIGPLFYNRRVSVETSPLFIRVSAEGESRRLIFARKFPPFIQTTPQRSNSAGFTIIEALTASSLFAVVVVGAVMPAIIALAHADQMAAQRQQALVVATNALADEEAGLAYLPVGSPPIADESRRSIVGTLHVTTTVGSTATPGLHSVRVQVDDDRGTTLVTLATFVGPPVPPPVPVAAPSP